MPSLPLRSRRTSAVARVWSGHGALVRACGQSVQEQGNMFRKKWQGFSRKSLYVLPIMLRRSNRMSSESSSLTVATRKRCNRAQYWAFFAKEDAACWHVVHQGREDLKTVQSPAHWSGH